MYIILKRTNDIDEVINVVYGNDETLVRNWVRDYINDDIESRKRTPLPENVKSIVYEMNDGRSSFELIQRTKHISKGYIYNSSEKKTDVLYSITLLQYNTNNVLTGLTADHTWANINNEINNRVLKQLDKESLYQTIVKLQQGINTKNTWNKIEFTSLLSDITRNFRKDLYSSVAKRMKRFGKKQNLVPENFNSTDNRSACKIEAIRIQNSLDKDDSSSI